MIIWKSANWVVSFNCNSTVYTKSVSPEFVALRSAFLFSPNFNRSGTCRLDLGSNSRSWHIGKERKDDVCELLTRLIWTHFYRQIFTSQFLRFLRNITERNALNAGHTQFVGYFPRNIVIIWETEGEMNICIDAGSRESRKASGSYFCHEPPYGMPSARESWTRATSSASQFEWPDRSVSGTPVDRVLWSVSNGWICNKNKRWIAVNLAILGYIFPFVIHSLLIG